MLNESTVAQLMQTIPARRGLATWVMARLKDADVIDLSGWQAQGDNLIVPFYEASDVLLGTIRIEQHATNVATIDEDTPLYQVLALIAKLDVDFLEDRYGVTWQTGISADAPDCIYVHDRSDSAFLRKLVNLVSFVQCCLDYGQGLDVRSHLADQLTLRNTTVREQADEIARLRHEAGELRLLCALRAS